MKKNKVYLKNKDLRREVMRCQEAGYDQPSEKLMSMFMLLGERIMRKMYYANPDDYYDCLNSGIENTLKYWKHYNPEYKNAFAYFTQVFKTGMAKGWNELHPKAYKGMLSIDYAFDDEDDEMNGIHSI